MKSVSIRIELILVAVMTTGVTGCRSIFSFVPRPQHAASNAVLTESFPEASEIDSVQQKINLIEARAALHEMDDQPRDALADYQSILEIDAEQVTALHRSAILHAQLGDGVRADENFQAALRLDESNAAIHKDYGYFCHLQGELESAESHLSQAISLEPGLLAAHNTLGIVYARMGRYDEARGEFQLAECSRAEALNNIAFARVIESDLETASAMYTDALEQDPDQAIARKSLDSLARISAAQSQIPARTVVDRGVAQTTFEGAESGRVVDR